MQKKVSNPKKQKYFVDSWLDDPQFKDWLISRIQDPQFKDWFKDWLIG